MRKFLVVGVLWLIFGTLCAIGQGAPPLDTFTSPDGTFHFVYPQTYELLVGERILKATQGRHQAISVCDFLTAIACVIYPVETEEETRFEAAAFSVDLLPGTADESECLTYADQLRRAEGDVMQPTLITIGNRTFRHAVTRKKTPGHVQTADFYRTFRNGKCYELHVKVSLADDAPAPRPNRPSLLGDPSADKARESLQLILSSVVFEQK
jgi:hypothetical protein